MNLADYQRRLEEGITPFVGRLMTPHMVAEVKATVVFVQREFLAENPDFVAAYEPRVESLDGWRVNVDAPVVTVREKTGLDHRNREAEHLLAELEAQQKRELESARRREASLRRHHRRLSSKHTDRIPPATRQVFPTLTIEQQYAILKDIDYDVRHGTRGVSR